MISNRSSSVFASIWIHASKIAFLHVHISIYKHDSSGRHLHLLPLSDQEMLALYLASAPPVPDAACEISADTLEAALCEADAAAKEKSNDWIRRAVTSKTRVLDAKGIVDKLISFISEGASCVHGCMLAGLCCTYIHIR